MFHFWRALLFRWLSSSVRLVPVAGEILINWDWTGLESSPGHASRSISIRATAVCSQTDVVCEKKNFRLAQPSTFDLFFLCRLRISGCPTSLTSAGSSRPFVGVLSTPRRRS